MRPRRGGVFTARSMECGARLRGQARDVRARGQRVRRLVHEQVPIAPEPEHAQVEGTVARQPARHARALRSCVAGPAPEPVITRARHAPGAEDILTKIGLAGGADDPWAGPATRRASRSARRGTARAGRCAPAASRWYVRVGVAPVARPSSRPGLRRSARAMRAAARTLISSWFPAIWMCTGWTLRWPPRERRISDRAWPPNRCRPAMAAVRARPRWPCRAASAAAPVSPVITRARRGRRGPGP